MAACDVVSCLCEKQVQNRINHRRRRRRRRRLQQVVGQVEEVWKFLLVGESRPIPLVVVVTAVMYLRDSNLAQNDDDDEEKNLETEMSSRPISLSSSA